MITRLVIPTAVVAGWIVGALNLFINIQQRDVLDTHRKLIDDLERDQVSVVSLLTSRIAAVERDTSSIPDILGKLVLFSFLYKQSPNLSFSN